MSGTHPEAAEPEAYLSRAAQLIDDQFGQHTRAADGDPASMPSEAILTDAQARALAKIARRIMTPDQRQRAAEELSRPD